MNYKKFGINIDFITDKSSDGFQFVKGFGGIGGFLRYKLELDDLIGANDELSGNSDFDPDEDFI
jgi:peptide chain release factor subunit 1